MRQWQRPRSAGPPRRLRTIGERSVRRPRSSRPPSCTRARRMRGAGRRGSPSPRSPSPSAGQAPGRRAGGVRRGVARRAAPRGDPAVEGEERGSALPRIVGHRAQGRILPLIVRRGAAARVAGAHGNALGLEAAGRPHVRDHAPEALAGRVVDIAPSPPAFGAYLAGHDRLPAPDRPLMRPARALDRPAAEEGAEAGHVGPEPPDRSDVGVPFGGISSIMPKAPRLQAWTWIGGAYRLGRVPPTCCLRGRRGSGLCTRHRARSTKRTS